MTDLIRQHIRALAKFEHEHERRVEDVLADYEKKGHRIIDGGQDGPDTWEIVDYRTQEVIAAGDGGLDGYAEVAEEHGKSWVHVDPITEHLFDVPDPATPGLPESLQEALSSWVRDRAHTGEVEVVLGSGEGESASVDAMRVEHDRDRVAARVLLVVGEVAELTTAERDDADPVRVSVARLAEDTGLAVGELPGRDVVVVLGPGGEPVRFEVG